ncbi:MAG: GNAT family N-acetyltransferase [Anaerolineae bacterium]
MQVFEFQDTEEQTLLCLNFDFAKDCESDREVAFHQLGRGKDVKRFWNYNTLFRGVRILVAYEETMPVGQLEYIPIEHAPKPVKGEQLTFIDCLFVEPKQRWHHVGSELIKACEQKVQSQSNGLAVIAYPDSLFMPAGFFIEHGFVVCAEQNNAWLMFKAWREVAMPQFMPRRYTPIPLFGKTTVDIFWNGQCPFWVRAHDCLLHLAKPYGERVVVNDINTDDRQAIEKYGIATGIYINGECAFLYPPSEIELRRALTAALKAALN